MYDDDAAFQFPIRLCILPSFIFEAEIKNVEAVASSFRNGIPASWVEFKTSNALVAKICFADGVCWAAKIQDRGHDDRAIQRGITAMILVGQHCPNIPINRYKGWGYGKLHYVFTEWIEGKTLTDEVTLGSESFSIPDKVVSQVAEFVYNLTSCPIPRWKSKKVQS
jgi:hypothetical protein